MKVAQMPVAKVEKKPQRAGVILHGWANDRDGFRRLHMLSGYSEGRFCEGDKCYTLPQGSVDAGESILTAASRELHEETGIDLKQLLGDAYARFSRGATVKDVASHAYKGVKVLSASPIPFKHNYVSSHGAIHESSYFAIEVDGIEHLRSHLKRLCAHEKSLGEKVRIPARAHMQANDLPDFDEMLTLLRTGVAPAHSKVAARKDADEVVIGRPSFPELEARYHASGPIHTKSEWLQFCKDLPGGDAYRALLGDMEAIKKHFERNGLISDSGAKLKLDTKDRPLTFYQEGAEIIPAGLLLERSSKVAGKTPLYARTMWGDYSGPRRPTADEMTRTQNAQITPLIDLVARLAPMELGIATAPTVKGLRAIKRGDAPASGTGYVARAFKSYIEDSRTGAQR